MLSGFDIRLDQNQEIYQEIWHQECALVGADECESVRFNRLPGRVAGTRPGAEATSREGISSSGSKSSALKAFQLIESGSPRVVRIIALT